MNDSVASWVPRFFVFGPFALGPDSQLLLKAGIPVRIGTRAFDILAALVERPGELVSKRDLFARVWPNTVVEEENLKVNIAALRKALGDDPAAAKYIATVTGRGYRFIAPVQTSESPGAAAAPAPISRGRDLPAEAKQIFGRAETFEAIRLGVEQARLVSIVGPGGIGKTTVAVSAARELSRDCGDGATFIDLAAISDTRLIPAVIASSLGLGTTGEDPLSGAILALKAQRRILVFDNCEHLLPAIAGAVDRLAGHLEGVKILATSREPLRIRGERVHRLSGLDCDPRVVTSASEALNYPAVELFTARASSRSGYRFTDDDAPAVAEICRRLDGNALAIELAATQCARFPPATIRAMLDDTFQLLRLGPPGAPLRHQTLLATLDWSYGLLSEREATMLQAVSVFAGPFAVEGALAVSGMETADVLDTLSQLAAKSLLAAEAAASPIRYRLLETTRTYAVERLKMSGDEQAVRHRHADYVCRVLERAALEWARSPAHEWEAAYGGVLDDLHAALDHCGRDGRDNALLLRLTVAGTRLWNHLSLSNECLVRVTRALQEVNGASPPSAPCEMALQLSLAGATMFTKGFVPEALSAARRAHDLAEQVGDVDCRLRSLRLIFSFEKFIGKHDAALHTIENFVALATTVDPSALPDGETHLGMAELYVGRLQDSRQRLERLYDGHRRRQNDPRFVRFLYDRNVDIMNVLSYAQWLTGSPESAMRTVEETVDAALKVQHGLTLTNALATAACPVFFQTGHFREAGHYVTMLDEQVLRHGVVIWRPIAKFYRSALTCMSGDDLAASIEGVQEAIDEFRSLDHWARMPYYLAFLAEVQARHGLVPEAERTLRAAIDRAGAQNERWCVPELLRIQGTVLAARGRAGDAEKVLAESIDLSQEMHAQSWRLRAANDLALLLRARSRVQEAHRMLLSIYGEFTEGFSTRDLATAADILRGGDRIAID